MIMWSMEASGECDQESYLEFYVECVLSGSVYKWKNDGHTGKKQWISGEFESGEVENVI